MFNHKFMHIHPLHSKGGEGGEGKWKKEYENSFGKNRKFSIWKKVIVIPIVISSPEIFATSRAVFLIFFM